MNYGIFVKNFARLSHCKVWIVLLSLCFSVLVMAVDPFSQLKQHVTLKITATGEKNNSSQGTEVWIVNFNERRSDISLPEGWERRDNAIVSVHHQPNTLTWSGDITKDFKLTLGQNAHSGLAEISANGKLYKLDLFSNASGTFELRASEFMVLTNTSTWVKLKLFLIGLALFACFLLFFGCIFHLLVTYNLLITEQESLTRNTPYVDRLDHLRLLAASLVIVYHFFYNYTGTDFRTDNILAAIVSNGYTGVGLFMVISGFIFGLIGYNKKIDYRAFIFNRVLRIYPLYLFVCFIALSAHRTEVSSTDVLFYLFPFFNTKLVYIPLFGQTWSIGVEFLFYLMFPFINQFVSRYGLKYIFYFLLLSVCLKELYYINSGTVRDLAYWTILGRMDQFLAGILFAHAYQQQKNLFRNPVHLCLSSLLAVGGIYGFNQLGGYFHAPNANLWIIWPLAESLIWAYLTVSYINCSIKIPYIVDTVLTRLGATSSSMYLMHNLIISVIVTKIGFLPIVSSTGTNVVITGIIIVIPTVCLLSVFTYHLIERPFSAYRMKYVSEQNSN